MGIDYEKYYELGAHYPSLDCAAIVLILCFG